MARPDLAAIEQSYGENRKNLEVSFPDNYAQLVELDMQNDIAFLKEGAIFAVIHDNNFPYSTEKLNTKKTTKFIALLNDSSSYNWGEFGCSEYSKAIVYYGKSSIPIGYTLIDVAGEVENFPYTSLMKWGALSNIGKQELWSLLEENDDSR